MLKKMILGLLFLLPLVCFSGENKIIERAIKKINNADEILKYNYSVEIESKDEKSLLEAEFDPLKNPKHTLLKVDGNTPTEKEIKEFNKDIEDEESDDSEGFDGVLKGDYTLLSKDGDISCYSYIAKMEIIPGKKSDFNGKIWVNEKTEEIVKVELINQKKIKIQVGVSLKSFVMLMEFKTFNNEMSVLDQMVMNIEGKAVVMEFSQKTVNKMYNYQLVN